MAQVFRILCACLIAIAYFVPAALADSPPPKLAPPDAAAQKAAMSLVDDAFKDDMASAKTPQQQIELAKKILQSGIDTKDDPAGRFAQFTRAENISAQAGDIETAFSAINEMDKAYQIDALQRKADIAVVFAKGIRPRDTLVSIAGHTNMVIDAAIAVDRYDLARQVAEVSLVAARRANDPALVKNAVLRVNEVEACSTAFGKLKASTATLAEKPTDPDANLAVGKFRCFLKSDWDTGLPMLALGSDATLKELAMKEMAGPTDAESQVALGDGWWTAAEKELASTRSGIQRHAVKWYSEAAPNLTGLTKARVTQRLRSTAEIVPAIPVILTRWIVLFRSADPTVWKTNTNRGRNDFAISLDKAPDDMKFLRMSIGGDKAVIVPLSKKQLTADSPIDTKYGWQGNSIFRRQEKACLLGIYNAEWGADVNGAVLIKPFNRGWGFGWRNNANDRQGYSWDGRELPPTVFEIAVTSESLKPDEEKSVLAAGKKE